MEIGHLNTAPLRAKQVRFRAALRQMGKKARLAKRSLIQQVEDDVFEHQAEAVDPAGEAKEVASVKDEAVKPRRLHFPRLKNLRRWLADPARRGRVISLVGLIISLVGICTANPILSLVGTTVALVGLLHTAYFDWKAYKI